jgi:hypothetical protein
MGEAVKSTAGVVDAGLGVSVDGDSNCSGDDMGITVSPLRNDA